MTKALSSWIDRILGGESVGRTGARNLVQRLVSGEEDDGGIKTLLLALNEKGFGEDELVGFAEGLIERAVAVDVKRRPLVDTCGTGGDGLESFNISTAAAFVTAGAGVAVAKHGNRSVSSQSGSADVIEALGVCIDPATDRVEESIEDIGFGFLFAPCFHPAMKHVASARRELGVRTIFNLIGPLVNPARVRRQVVGIYDPGLLETYARVLLRLGARRVMVVCGEDGMDELSLAAPTRICHGSEVSALELETIRPEDTGLDPCDPRGLIGGDATDNARTLERVLGGRPGPSLDVTLLNSAASLVVAEVVDTLRDGVEMARNSVTSGQAQSVLERVRSLVPRRTS